MAIRIWHKLANRVCHALMAKCSLRTISQSRFVGSEGLMSSVSDHKVRVLGHVSRCHCPHASQPPNVQPHRLSLGLLDRFPPSLAHLGGGYGRSSHWVPTQGCLIDEMTVFRCQYVMFLDGDILLELLEPFFIPSPSQK